MRYGHESRGCRVGAINFRIQVDVSNYHSSVPTRGCSFPNLIALPALINSLDYFRARVPTSPRRRVLRQRPVLELTVNDGEAGDKLRPLKCQMPRFECLTRRQLTRSCNVSPAIGDLSLIAMSFILSTTMPTIGARNRGVAERCAIDI